MCTNVLEYTKSTRSADARRSSETKPDRRNLSIRIIRRKSTSPLPLVRRRSAAMKPALLPCVYVCVAAMLPCATCLDCTRMSLSDFLRPSLFSILKAFQGPFRTDLGRAYADCSTARAHCSTLSDRLLTSVSESCKPQPKSKWWFHFSFNIHQNSKASPASTEFNDFPTTNKFSFRNHISI